PSRQLDSLYDHILSSQSISNNFVVKEESPQIQKQKIETLALCLPNKYKELISRPPLETYMDPALCGKWIVLRKLLAYWHTSGPNKVIIFSFSILHLNILQSLLANTSYTSRYYTGELTLDERHRVITEFNSDPTIFVLLISTRA